MNDTRENAGAAVLNDHLYVVGGTSKHLRTLDTAEYYDLRKSTWISIASMNSKRSSPGIATLHGQIFVVGGYDGVNVLDSCESYDPNINKWTPVKLQIELY